MSWIAVIALFLVLSGIYLWWPRMRFAIGKMGGRPFWYDVHATLGIAAAVFLILLTVSGMFLGFVRLALLLYPLTGSELPASPEYPLPPAAGTQPISIDRALAIAHNALPSAVAFTGIGLQPLEPFYVVTAHTPGDPDPAGGSRVFIDKYTGKVLGVMALDTAPTGTQLEAWNRAIHTGSVFGIFSKVVMSLASLIIALLALSGAVMWIKRVPARDLIPAFAATAVVTAIALYTVFAPT